MGFKLGAIIAAAAFVVITVVAIVIKPDNGDKKGVGLEPIHNTDTGQSGKGFEHTQVQNTGRDKGY